MREYFCCFDVWGIVHERFSLQRKLDEANQLMKRKETEFEETMDHLQADIDSLECEKGELKDKLKSYSKKVLVDGIVKNATASSMCIEYFL